jgi:hypothetical protein
VGSAEVTTDGLTIGWVSYALLMNEVCVPLCSCAEAFADRDAPRYLLRDRDSIYGSDVRLRIASLGMEEVLTPPQSPWQNPYAERLIGSIRRDCLNHFVILNARHLKRTMASYFAYYHRSRTIWRWTSNVHFLGRSPATEGLSRSHNSAACITVMNALQRNKMPADVFLASHRIFRLALWGFLHRR